MRPEEALRVEGKSEYSILCYGIFSGTPNSGFETLKVGSTASSKFHTLMDSGWPNYVVLEEISAPLESSVPAVVVAALENMVRTDSCLAAACLYDGAFTTYDDLFSSDIASQTYAFSLARGEPVIALSSEVLDSAEWETILSAVRTNISTAAKAS